MKRQYTPEQTRAAYREGLAAPRETGNPYAQSDGELLAFLWRAGYTKAQDRDYRASCVRAIQRTRAIMAEEAAARSEGDERI